MSKLHEARQGVLFLLSGLLPTELGIIRTILGLAYEVSVADPIIE